MQDIFRRREKKYLITTEQGKALQRLIRRYAEIDRQGEYLVQDLYYDTDIVQTLFEGVKNAA